MQTVTISDAKARLDDIVGKLHPGEEIILTKDEQPVARLLPFSPSRPPRPLSEFAGRFRPLPQAEQDNLKSHDREWCEPWP
ncbi:MAG TPA: type II toxin-antitoxin system Phd/YefM family antitoxin [Candidatus Acidoferrum sp.]|nr:type II toxin-antitoxin system Phd/YefM family antitoxin [Candidatus Acidoferrum sp.]